MLHAPVFILGCPRSGTTFLAELLKFTSYGKPFETRFIAKFGKKLSLYGDITQKENFHKLVTDISKERAVLQWGVNIDPDIMFKELVVLDYVHICDYICRLKSDKKGYKHWSDKTPIYLLDLDIIYSLFPHSKYIFIVRDGRDVALSLLEKPWGPNNFFSCAASWKKYNSPNTILDELEEKKQIFSLRYEDLLDNVEEIVPQLYNFIGEKFHDEKVASLVNKTKHGNYNKWKTQMSFRQIKLFENIAGNTLNKFGYETQHKERRLNTSIKLFYKIHEQVAKAMYLFKLNIIDAVKIRVLGKEPFAE